MVAGASTADGRSAPPRATDEPDRSGLITLTRRSEFHAASRARRKPMPGFVLQARARKDGTEGIRVGFTCSRKVGNAVARNRAKRRLRAISREVLPVDGRNGWDYVLIGRAETTAARPYAMMLTELRTALARLHALSAEPSA